MTESATDKQWGITRAISTLPPTEKDLEVTKKLQEELTKMGSYESPEEAARREMVLARVAVLVKKFVQKVMIARGHSESAARNAGGKIFTFGSYRLGVHGPGSDIDCLCVAPKHVEREDFFTYFEPMLKEFDGAVEVAGVPDAYVPIITAVISGIPIDFLFARLALPAIPDDLELKDDNLLKNLDERCVRSLGGSRVTDQILRLVPDVATFRIALRCIKIWAPRRAIYSNVMGFLGGVAWAMLVARICQLYPNAAAATIVHRFFVLLAQWDWPRPVQLTKIEEGPLQVRVWNPKIYPSDRAHRMPIITPAYPAMCSTHNVSASQLQVMTQEFKRGADIAEKIVDLKAGWEELFTKHNFFHHYHHYLQIVAAADEQESALKWSGKVESQVRQLVLKLEFVEGLMLAHPYVKGIEHKVFCKSEEELDLVTRGTFTPAILQQTEEDIQDVPGARIAYTSTYYVGLGIRPKDPSIPGGRKLDVTYPTNEFIKQLKLWESYDPSSMSIVISSLKAHNLPDDVFEPGERPQPKSLKRKSKVTFHFRSRSIATQRWTTLRIASFMLELRERCLGCTGCSNASVIKS
ncbi:Poly(A) polymerase [Clavulina sp. PMI_390]|nr:Poly(A) polymerase [Clavulina sp. PMI_390]